MRYGAPHGTATQRIAPGVNEPTAADWSGRACLQVKQDWQFVSNVLDRLMFYLFTAVWLVGTFGIIAQAPTLYDNRVPIKTPN